MTVPTPDAVGLLTRAYEPLLALSDGLDEATGWRATHLPGWCVRDLVFHLAGDCQRALVALATPTDAEADTDEVSYWSHWQPGTDGAQAGLRGNRIIASLWSSVRGPAGLHAETARAVLVAAERADPTQVVTTQGRRLRVAALLHTLAVEAGLHHLDLGDAVLAPPADDVLAAVRHVLDGLLGTPAPGDWDDARWARVGTGRAEPTAGERAALGSLAGRLPLFG